MKRFQSMVLSAVMMSILLTGCGGFSSSKTYTFTVDNGDKISIKLDTSDNYDLTSNVPFEINYNGEVQSQGTFIQGEAYEQYVEVANGDPNAKVLDSGEKDGNEYIFWSYDNTEYNYAVRVEGSDTGLVIGNAVSEESARECFNRLTITVAD